MNVKSRLAAQSGALLVRDAAFHIRSKRSALADPGHLPNLLIAGAQRCGTTSLARWLELTGTASPGRRKEVHFFDRHFKLGTDWYQRQFAVESAFDATPDYLFVPGAAELIASVLPPSVSIVVLVRDPAERALSHYHYQRKRHYEWRPLDRSLDDEYNEFCGIGGRLRESAQRHFSYVRGGLYGEQLANLRSALPANPLLVVDFHRLYGGDNAERTVLEQFLSVDSEHRGRAFPGLNSAPQRVGTAKMPDWAHEHWAADRPLLESLSGRTFSWD